MEKLIVLIDFTNCCKIALHQASVVAKKYNGTIVPVHIAREDANFSTIQGEVMAFAEGVVGKEILSEAVIGSGDYMEEAALTVNAQEPDLVVLGTHGIRGIKQHLFGAYILKLVQAIKYPCLVVQENTVVKDGGFTKILLPVGSHDLYAMKVEQTAKIAMTFQAEILEYDIQKLDLGSSDQMEKNSKMAKEYFITHSIAHTKVKEHATVISVGYSRQTIQFCESHGVDCISIMSDIPSKDIFIEKADKENILTNPPGIPVLCCNG